LDYKLDGTELNNACKAAIDLPVFYQ